MFRVCRGFAVEVFRIVKGFDLGLNVSGYGFRTGGWRYGGLESSCG